MQLVHDRQLGREGAARLLVPNAMSVPVQSSSPPRRHVRLQGLGLGRRKVPEQVGSSVQTPRKPPSKRAPSGHMHHDFWFRTRYAMMTVPAEAGRVAAVWGWTAPLGNSG